MAETEISTRWCRVWTGWQLSRSWVKLAMSSARYESAGLRGVLKPRGLPDRAGFPIEVPKRNMGGRGHVGPGDWDSRLIDRSRLHCRCVGCHTPSGGHGRPGGL